MTKKELEKAIKKATQQEIQEGKYGNGNPAHFKRFVEDGREYTLILDENEGAMLYIGEEGATVTRIKEGRREDSLLINGKRATFAGLYAKHIIDEKNYTLCAGLEG